MNEDPKKRGRRRKAEGEKIAARALNVRISEEEFNRLSDFCKRKNKRVVDVVRSALKEYIDAQDQTRKQIRKIADRIRGKRDEGSANATHQTENEGGNNEDAKKEKPDVAGSKRPS